MIELNKKERLSQIIELAWEIIFQKIISKKLTINKESSLQLHLSKTIFDLGNLYCIFPNEDFEIEMETKYEKKSIDIVCILRDNTEEVKCAIELKCFMKNSNRAKDIDCYDALIDIERLQNFDGFDLTKFICLTDHKYYAETVQKGKAKSVSIMNGTKYLAETEIVPGWKDEWKIKRDKSIIFKRDIEFNWTNKENWYFLLMNI
ncbi:hypothetical protein QO190_11025 [Cloacibacterium sp. Arc13]|uniref:hypothetical protein n=1 Tax=unclassified Cloacibacterium TaxID=2620870 RepID=UPI00352EEF0B